MIYEKLFNIQQNLKAPKGQFNDFGKYKYRSLEDILEAVKPILNENRCTLNISDTIVCEGDGPEQRYFVMATAVLTDIETGEQVSNTALARESFQKKGMDESQITGTASSYARKYCLNGLFAIDDTKDADSNEYREINTKRAAAIEKGIPQDLPADLQEELLQDATERELATFKELCATMGLDHKEVWKQTGKAKDLSKAHLGAAQKWVRDHATAIGKN